MESIRTTKTARLRRLKMYREDLDEFVGLFQKACEGITISDNKNRYASLDEMQIHCGSKIQDFDIRGEQPAVHFLLNRKEVVQGTSTPAIFNELRTEEITDEADALFLKVKDFLEERQRPTFRPLPLALAFVALVALIFFIARNLGATRVPLGAIIATLAIFIFGIPAVAFNNILTLERKANSPSFWVRNREEFAKYAVTSGISAAFGVLVGWLIGHFHK